MQRQTIFLGTTKQLDRVLHPGRLFVGITHRGARSWNVIRQHLDDFLLHRFSPADAYLFTVTNWTGNLKVDMSKFPNVLAFQKRIAARPAVQAAMKEEGLIQ